MTWSYVGFGLWIIALLAALALVASGLFEIRFEAWRLVYLLAPVAVLALMFRLVRNLGGR